MLVMIFILAWAGGKLLHFTAIFVKLLDKGF